MCMFLKTFVAGQGGLVALNGVLSGNRASWSLLGKVQAAGWGLRCKLQAGGLAGAKRPLGL